jgi:hypothetical protein
LGELVRAAFGAGTVLTLYRVVAPDGSTLGEGNSIDEIIQFVKQSPSGRYRVDLVQSGPGNDDETSRTWGEVIKTIRGRIKLNAPPWAD